MHASGDFKDELMKTAKEICSPGKGILAADESTGTIGKRFDGISVENNHDNRQAYRELLFTAPGLEECPGQLQQNPKRRTRNSSVKKAKNRFIWFVYTMILNR